MNRVFATMSARLWELWTSEEGQDLVEYGLVTLFVVCVTILSISPLATYVNSVFQEIIPLIA